MTDTPAPILLLCRDLMFVSKVSATARALGVAVRGVRDPGQLATVQQEGQGGGRLLGGLDQGGAGGWSAGRRGRRGGGGWGWGWRARGGGWKGGGGRGGGGGGWWWI